MHMDYISECSNGWSKWLVLPAATALTELPWTAQHAGRTGLGGTLHTGPGQGGHLEEGGPPVVE